MSNEILRGDGAIRRPGLTGSSIENTFGGVLSFMRRKYTRDIAGADVVVSGVPLDLATTYRPGVRFGPAAALARILEIVGEHPAYVTFDIDCLDPAYAPGTGTPVAGGLTSAQALQIVRGLAPVNIVGCDVVEVSPPYDHADITALAAAHVACDLLCVLRNRKLGITG